MVWFRKRSFMYLMIFVRLRAVYNPNLTKMYSIARECASHSLLTAVTRSLLIPEGDEFDLQPVIHVPAFEDFVALIVETLFDFHDVLTSRRTQRNDHDAVRGELAQQGR